jgi:hypothetical protein
LRIRVSMSAIGSVIMAGFFLNYSFTSWLS